MPRSFVNLFFYFPPVNSYFLDALSYFRIPSDFRNKYDFFRNGWQLWGGKKALL